jgi:predicted amino acid racemase
MKKNAIVYCENELGKIDGKVANGLVRHSEKYTIIGIIDSTKSGLDAGECLDGIKNGIPIFSSMDIAMDYLDPAPEYFIYGIAPLESSLDQQERGIFFNAMERGLNIVNGLAEYFTEDQEFVQKAKESNIEIIDIRKPPLRKELHHFSGRIFDINVPVIAVLGTDSAVGKRTTALLLVKALKQKGLKVAFISTGQTGLIQGAKYGIAIDVLSSGYATGAVENAVFNAYKSEQPNIIIVEGQGALSHPAFLSSCAIVKGAQPDAIVLQHAPKRKTRCDYPKIAMPKLDSEIEQLEVFSQCDVIAITINNEGMTSPELIDTIQSYEFTYQRPTTNVLKYGCKKLLLTPKIEFNLKKIAHNAKALIKMYHSKGIDIIGVTKAVCGNIEIANTLVKSGIQILGDSKICNIKKMRHAGVDAKFLLTRIPSISQVNDVVKFVDISLNSEWVVIQKLSQSAIKYNRIHKIILMVELGDLREGLMPSDLKETVKQVLKLKGIELDGIGTNLSCFGGIQPDKEKMLHLSSLAEDIEKQFKLKLRVVSGGNSANYNWFNSSKNVGKINNLRLGESIFLGCETLYRKPIPGLFTDAFTLIAEVIESKNKPSVPYGKIGQNAFGKTQFFPNLGQMKRAILGIGLQDVLVTGLIPRTDIKILGASSDHTVVNAKLINLSVGSQLEFDLNYAALLSAMTSPYVIKMKEKIVKYQKSLTQ